MHTFNYDEEIPSTSNLAEACGYEWSETIRVLGRDRSLLHTTGWEGGTYLGFGINGDSIKREIENRCGRTSPTPGSEATVTAYYLIKVNRATRAGVTLPSIFLSAFTLGVLPFYSEDHVALCLDIALPDGRHRYGLVEGSQRQREMLGNLLPRALHKAWIPGQGNLAQPNCEAALNSIVE